MVEENVERRLAAILAADVVGYSRLMGADEAGTRARFNAHLHDLIEPAIAGHRGRIVSTTGDGLLVEFASVVDAVHCAVDIQKGMADRNADEPDGQRLEFRIGINLGDVIVEGDDIHGDGVNVAARLETLAEAGGVCISGTVYDQVRDKIDLVYESMGEQQVKNIERPVRAYRIALGADASDAETAQAPSPPPLWRRWPAAAALVLIVGGLAWWQPWITRVEPASVERMAFKLPDKPSIAVLPFDDFSEKKDQEFFADGLTEEIISNLATFENIFVIARNSTSKFKGKAVDVRTVAEDLGVRYVLEGSIRRAGNDLRVTAQLVDAIGGRHIWADKYDRKMKDIFALQDEITREIASRLVSKVAAAEFLRRSRKQTSSPEAYSLFLQGWNASQRSNPESNARAIRFFKQSITADPNYGRAYALLGWAHRHNAVRGWGKSTEGTLDHALNLTRKGVALAPEDSVTHRHLGLVESEMRHIPEALAAIEKAVALSPGDAAILMSYATTLVRAGRAEEAVRTMELALRLDPHGPFLLHMVAGLLFFHTGQYEKSVGAFERARRINPRGKAQAMALHAAAYAQLGKMDDARAAREAYLKLNPKYSIESHRRPLKGYSPKIQKRAVDSLRKAGFPEHPPLKLPDKPSVAVLPFANMSGDKAQEYFSDGITEDIITDLSKVSGLFVIARTSTNRYKGKADDIRKIARELGVRYVVEGSVRKAADRVRITAQLIDAGTGNHVWAERYDRDLKDVFAIQDEVTAKIVSSLAIELNAEDKVRTRGKYIPTPEAHDLVVQGTFARTPPTPRNLARAGRLLERAIEIDPNYARAYGELARARALAATIGASRSRENDLVRATKLATKAISLEDRYAVSHVALANVHFARKRLNDAVTAVEKAVQIQPNDINALNYLAWYSARAGQPAKGVETIERALRMAPLDPTVHSFAGATYFLAGDYARSVKHFEQRQKLHRRSNVLRESVRIAAEMLIGKEDAARATVQWILRQRPDFTVSAALRNYHFPDDTSKFADLLRRAGLPEGEAPKPKLPPLSIVVLPFDNLSGDPKQDYLADGITEDLITDLSRIRDAFVIARGTSFTYRGKAVDPKAVAKDLNVRYVLEGSMRRAGDQVRVNAQLIDGETGAHVWSERFDRTFKNTFSLQNEITGRIASVMKAELLEAESRQSEQGNPADLKAWDYALQANVKFFVGRLSPKRLFEAKKLLDKAMALDPNLSMAWAGTAFFYYIASTRGLPGISIERARKLGLNAANKAIELDPKDSEAHTWLGSIFYVLGEPDRGMATCQKALTLNPNNDDAYVCIGLTRLGIGQTKAAFAMFKKSERLNPRFRAWRRDFFYGLSHLLAKEHEKAVQMLRRAIPQNPKYSSPYFALSSALAWSNRIGEAKKVLADYLRYESGHKNTIAKMRKRFRFISPDFNHVLEGLRRAGMPEK